MQIARTETFRKAWKKLSQEDKALGRKVIMNMAVGFRYPGLKVNDMAEAGNVREARVSDTVRLTFQVDGDTIILRNIGQYETQH